MNPSASFLKTLSAAKWEKVGLNRRSGILVPLFAVFSKDSIGIGDLDDLKLLVDWTAACGGSLLQLLPMNEMGVLSCPYDAVSSFALEPAYLSLVKIDPPLRPELIQEIKNKFSLPAVGVNYDVKNAKLRALWDNFKPKQNAGSLEFQEFIRSNNYWLEDFTVYKVLKYYQKGRAWYEWEEKYKNRDAAALMGFKEEHSSEIIFQSWLQWQLFRQFSQAKRYAVSQGIFLKGDLPVLVSRDSADVWAHPDFFKLEFAAGAPPDMYCAKGQRWGMPPYHWERISQDGYRYLKEKLKFAENFYDILRIDHVVGLFRIWSIPYQEPLENQGLNGFFDPREESRWQEHGRAILARMLEGTKMLLCAEDLGVIPKVCTDTLRELGIPGNDVQRWTKDWKTRHDFLPAQEYRMLSVAVLSTHDTTNWPAWWENEAGTVDESLFKRRSIERGIDYNLVKNKLFDPRRSRHARLRWQDEIDSVEKLITILGKKRQEVLDFIDFYENSYHEKEKLWRYLNLSGPLRENCDAEILRAVLEAALGSCAIFCIQAALDILLLGGLLPGDPYQYRINTPGTTGPDNWSWAVPLSLEDLIRHRITRELKEMASVSERI